MRAVWSFWTKPFQGHHGWSWETPRHHLLAWVLSVETARRHFPTTALVTDDEGARMLVDGLGLEFDQVSTELDALRDRDPEWWAMGKLYAYRSQSQPFVHLDTDVFLWEPLPENMLRADVLAQNPEEFPLGGDSWYRPELLDSLIQGVQGWAPEEWTWYSSVGGNRALCCGIVGGNAVGFLRHYADLAIQLIEHPRNQPAWSLLGQKIGDNVVIEQYFLSACLEYHRNRDDSPFRKLEVQCLFPSTWEAFSSDHAARAGYTHLIGLAKKNTDLLQRLEARVQRDYPAYYERCLMYLGEA